jgi:Uncharacterized protein conserved in bacteria (DUF2188)
VPAVDYLIVPDGAKWKVKLGTIEYSPYDTAEEAIAAAIEGAHAAGKSGLSATVFMQTSDGRWRRIWTYGSDQYPP